MPRIRLIAALGLALVAGPSALAQDKPKDDLDRLLENLEKKDKAPEAKPDEKKVDEPKDKKADEKKPEAKKDGEKTPADKPKGEVEPKDKDLDDLLGKLGGSTDTPDAKGKPTPPMPGGPGGDPKPGAEKKEGGLSDAEQKKLDEELEIRAGKIKKPKNQQQQQGQGQGGGALDDAIKQMKQVEERLGKTDTGEKTREEQKEIVKKLDTILQQLRRQQGQGRQMARGEPKPGGQPGQQDQPNPNGPGTPPAKPKTPSLKDILSDDKQPWGNLPSSMRQDIANIAKEGMLEAKKSLIERYFTTVAKKTATKGE